MPTKQTTKRKRAPSPSAVVEKAVRRVMDEVENRLPDKQDIWIGFLQQFVELVKREEERLEERHIRMASELADRALSEAEQRFPGAMEL